MNESILFRWWSRLKPWAVGALASVALFLSLRYWKRRAISVEAEREIERSKAEVRGLERLKEQVRIRSGANSQHIAVIDDKIKSEKEKAVKHVADVSKMSADEVSAEFERLGY